MALARMLGLDAANLGKMIEGRRKLTTVQAKLRG
jgi:DNA-binding transcriptional regulator YdaS (Cro superfamily)